jgi:hypothetical protein
MDVDITRDTARSVVHVTGDLDDPVSLIGAVHVALVNGPDRLLLNLRDCTDVHQAGMSGLVAVSKLCERMGVPIDLAASAVVLRRIDPAGLRSRFRSSEA